MIGVAVTSDRHTDKRALLKINFLISQPKYILWVLQIMSSYDIIALTK